MSNPYINTGVKEIINNLQQKNERFKELFEFFKDKSNLIDIEKLELKDLIDISLLEKIITDLYKLTNAPVYIVDNKNKIIADEGLKYFNDQLSEYNTEAKEKLFKECFINKQASGKWPTEKQCKHGLRSITQSIQINHKILATIVISPFFTDDEKIDKAFFKKEAKKYGFKPEDYLRFIENIPTFSRGYINNIIEFLLTISQFITNQGFYNFQLLKELSLHQETENALLRSENEYQMLTLNINDVIWIMDLNYKFKYVSPSTEKLFGYSIEERKKIPLKKLLAPESFHSIQNAINYNLNLLKKGKTPRAPIILDLQGCHKNGRRIWLEVTADFLYDDNKNVIGIVGVSRDATDRKKAENKIKSSEKFFRRITENMFDIVAMTDRQGNFKYISPSANHILGYQTEDLIGKNSFNYIHPKEKAQIINIYLSNINKKEARIKKELRWKHAKGHYVWLECAGQTLIDDKGNIEGAIINSHDITERKIAEEKEKQYLYNTEFLKQTAMEFADFPANKNIYDYVANNVQSLTDKSFVIVNRIDKEKNVAYISSIAGINKIYNDIIKLIGRNPINEEVPLDETHKELLSGNIEKYNYGGIHELTQGKIPKNTAQQFEKLFNISDIYALGLINEGQIFATIIILKRDIKPIENQDTIKTFCQQAGIALQKRYAEKNLKRYINNLQIINEVSKELINLPVSADLHQFLCDKIRLLAPNSIIIATATNHSQNLLTIKSLSCSDNIQDKISNKYNKDIREVKYEISKNEKINEIWPILTSQELNTLPGGLDDLTFFGIDKEKIESIKKTINLKKIYVIGLYWDGKLYGNIAIITQNSHDLRNKQLIETIVKETTISIQKKITKEALEQSEEKFRIAFRTSPDSINLNRMSDGLYLEINEGFTNLTGFTKEDVKGKTSYDINIWKNNEERKEMVKMLMRDGFVQNYEAQFRLKNGEVRTGLMSANIVKLYGENYILSITRDIEDIKKVQEELIEAKNKAQEADRLKSAFLANMSHEIRTPMNGIMGFSELLMYAEHPREKQNKYLKFIHDNTKQLLNLIDDIIDISRIESGQMNLEESATNINEVLTELHHFFEAEMAKEKKEKINVSVNKGLPDDKSVIKTDKTRLKQILINLITNSLKFTREGSIEFGYEYTENENNILTFFVKDTGIGIPKDKQDIIFERFKQADNTTTREYGGTGLGLAISKEIIHLMNGQIWVESEPLKGATFYFTLPYKAIKKATEKQNNEKDNIPDLTNKTILIVEDNFSSIEYLKAIFKHTNATLIFSKTGKEAIKEFKAHPETDLVLMDINLPEMDGYETTKHLKNIRKGTPVVAQTAYAMQDEGQKAIDEGFDDYISKPIKMNMLFRKINKLIGAIQE